MPHELIDALANFPGSTFFNSVILGNQSESARIQFWQHVKQLKPWRDHPALCGDDYNPSKLIGICIHGDGCQMFKDDEVFVWSISSVFAQEGVVGDVLVFKFPFAVVPEKHMRSPTAPGLDFVCFHICLQNCVVNCPMRRVMSTIAILKSFSTSFNRCSGKKASRANGCPAGSLVAFLECQRSRTFSGFRR